MAYTIIGMFPTTEAADKASDTLESAGFAQEDYHVSKYAISGTYDPGKNYDFDDDEKTHNFWTWLFGEDEDNKKKYSYAGTKSNLVTVYTDELDRAEKAKHIMNDAGAINVNDFTKDRYSHHTLDAEEKARIINKAKNDLYFINTDRSYTLRSPGMESTMDDQGSADIHTP